MKQIAFVMLALVCGSSYAQTLTTNACYVRDPACDAYSTPLLYYKGFHALQAYRVTHWLWGQGRKTLALMTSNHLPGNADLADVSTSLFSEATYRGIGFGLGFAMTTDVARTAIAGSLGEYWWGGAASTAFWVDPVEDLSVVFMTQFMPSSLYPIRRELRTLVNAAVVDSKA